VSGSLAIDVTVVACVRHLDNHSLWVPNGFAVRCFKVIMYSVQVSSWIIYIKHWTVIMCTA